MMKVTIEGPQGCGKTLASYVVFKWAQERGLRVAVVDEGSLDQLKYLGPIEVLIIEKQTKA